MSRASTDEQAIGQLAAQFPGWHIWAARCGDGTPGELMATRRRDLTTAGIGRASRVWGLAPAS